MKDVTEYFTGLADAYARHRPSYPAAAVAAMLEGLPAPVRAADIGCGTGISTRLLAEAGATVTGIDPNDDMLEQAAAVRVKPTSVAPTYRKATAEATGIATASVDLVLCAQAFHWFDDSTALTEFHRVLRPGGRLALLWNVRTQQDTFGAAYEKLIERAQEDTVGSGRLVRRNRGYQIERREQFTNERELVFDNPHRLDWPGLLGRARSASYFPREARERQEMEDALQRLFDAHHRDGVVELPQISRLTLADRASV
jgi:ubiquinone/menaquinone biosynthesis C-methylase UbiE